jgi:hypothetical protein
MKSNLIRIFACAVLGLFAVCISAKPAAAQPFQGSFTLPDEVRWQNTVLPAGDYTFSIASTTFPATMVIRGKNQVAVVISVGLSEKPMEAPSHLRIERRGETRYVRELYLADSNLHLRYFVPKPENRELLAQGAATTEQILVAKR